MTIYNKSKLRVICNSLYLIIPIIVGLCLLPEYPIFGGLLLVLLGFLIYSSIRHRKDHLVFDEEKISIIYGNIINEFRWRDIEKYYIKNIRGHATRRLHILTFDGEEHVFDITEIECSDDDFNQSWEQYAHEMTQGKGFAIHDTSKEDDKKWIIVVVVIVILVIIAFFARLM